MAMYGFAPPLALPAGEPAGASQPATAITPRARPDMVRKLRRSKLDLFMG